jgi:uncharacterized membrane protein
MNRPASGLYIPDERLLNKTHNTNEITTLELFTIDSPAHFIAFIRVMPQHYCPFVSNFNPVEVARHQMFFLQRVCLIKYLINSIDRTVRDPAKKLKRREFPQKPTAEPSGNKIKRNILSVQEE